MGFVYSFACVPAMSWANLISALVEYIFNLAESVEWLTSDGERALGERRRGDRISQLSRKSNINSENGTFDERKWF